MRSERQICAGQSLQPVTALLITTILLLLLSSSIVHADPWGPWSVNDDAPVLLSKADNDTPVRKPPEEYHGIASTPFLWLLKGYQNYISPVKGDRCPMYPTCSQYSVLSIRKHGPVIGIIMTADRLIHESDEPRFVPYRKVGNRYRFIDPVENNDFWWYTK